MTDTHYYEIKSLSVEDKKKGKKNFGYTILY